MAKASAAYTPPRPHALSLGVSAAVVVASDVTVGATTLLTVTVTELIPLIDWTAVCRSVANVELPRPVLEEVKALETVLAVLEGTVIVYETTVEPDDRVAVTAFAETPATLAI